MSLREKVARAFARQSMGNISNEDLARYIEDGSWEAYLTEADAAIAAVMEALGEPSDGMVDAIDPEGHHHFSFGYAVAGSMGHEGAWHRMLRQFKVEQGIG